MDSNTFSVCILEVPDFPTIPLYPKSHFLMPLTALTVVIDGVPVM